MGTIFEKLAYTKQAREEIQQAIVEKGVQCPSDAAFCTFDDFIRSITTGEGGDAILQELIITENGTFLPETPYNGFSKVTAKIPVDARGLPTAEEAMF